MIKSVFGVETIDVLGYRIGNGTLRPDPNRLSPLLNMPPTQNNKAMQRMLSMFAHYSKWIPKFSKKIRLLITNETFPINDNVLRVFEALKKEITNAVVVAVDENVPFTIETDASEFSIAAQLTQGGRPVAFFSRTLNSSERQHSAVEKEAYAIVESVRRWRHYLIGRYFKIITVQQSVSFMFHIKRNSKIKNDKIMRWRLELASYSYDIVYRPGKYNGPADTLSRAYVNTATSIKELEYIHNSLCHPGVTRLHHFVKCKNLAYSVDQ